MKKTMFLLMILFCPNLFAATLTPNTIPYVCQGGSNPQLCNLNMTTDSNGNFQYSQIFTSSGTFTVPKGVNIVYLTMVSGGGGGDNGEDHGGGGGAGGNWIYSYPYIVTLTPEALTLLRNI